VKLLSGLFEAPLELEALMLAGRLKQPQAIT
jgi:hypothetical protein